MDQDTVIRLAREASGGTTWWPIHNGTLERFAALVAQAEREECAKVCEQRQFADIAATAIRARGEK